MHSVEGFPSGEGFIAEFGRGQALPEGDQLIRQRPVPIPRATKKEERSPRVAPADRIGETGSDAREGARQRRPSGTGPESASRDIPPVSYHVSEFDLAARIRRGEPRTCLANTGNSLQDRFGFTREL